MKQNCWEYKKCGREPGGPKSFEFGACWVVAGSLCGGRVQGDEDQKRAACWECDFLRRVRLEEETSAVGFMHTRLGMDRVLARMRAV